MCLDLFKFPQTLYPCGHTMCLRCINQLKNARDNRERQLVCFECKSVCDAYAPNHVVDGVLSRSACVCLDVQTKLVNPFRRNPSCLDCRYGWWMVVLSDCRSQLKITAEAETKTRNLQVLEVPLAGTRRFG